MAVSVAPHTHSTGRNAANNGGKWMKVVYLQCYFVTIATILGTGILGLPVTLARSGIYPFLISFLAGFLFQILLVLFFTDLLQRAHAVQIKNAKEGQGAESLPLNDIAADELDFDDLEDEQETNGPVLAGHVIIPKDLISVRPPNLHLLAELFLGCGMRQIFDILILFHFISILISYALAGSEAYAEVIGTDYMYIIPVFVWTLTFFIVFALSIIQPIVSILTFLKGSLLLGTVGVTFLVGAQIHHEIINDFAYVGAPFLMGTVALGGVINVMPFLYGKISPVQSQVKGFRNAVVGGIVTCTLLNVLWCWSVLEIVPQLNSCFMYTVQMNNSFHTVQEGITDSQMVCSHNLSLESAGEQGQISTIPLTQIIHQLYPQYNWIALLIEMFITISITVSYLTVGAALHHTLSGCVDSLWTQDRYSAYTTKIELADAKLPCCNSRCICRSLLSLTAFGVVFAVAMLNPQGFVSLLEKIASLALNLEAGIFVFVMMLTSRNTENKKLKIPLSLPRWVYHLQYLLPVYFGFAVGYDVYISIHDLVHKGGLDHDLHKGLHVGGPFTVPSNVTHSNGMLSAVNGTGGLVNFTDFVTGEL